MFELIIIGGGPAAAGAGIYSARKKLKTLVLAKELGGQSSVSPIIQNWIGEVSIAGNELSDKIEKHLRSYEGENLEVKASQEVIKIEQETTGSFLVKTADATYESKAVLLASGGRRRKLSVKGADVFEHKGLTYCASCDGPLFTGLDVAVIGGGNAGFGTASQLLAYCNSVTLVESNPQFRAEQITIDKLSQDPKFKAFKNIELLEIIGDKFVSGLQGRDKSTGEKFDLAIKGIFVEIGFQPNTEMVNGLISLNPAGHVIVDAKTQRTSLEGVWAAGDCADGLFHQNNIAVGDAVKAVEDIYNYLKTH